MGSNNGVAGFLDDAPTQDDTKIDPLNVWDNTDVLESINSLRDNIPVEQQERKNRQQKNFENSKNQVLGKRDKSSAGRIDPKAVEICGLINEKFDCYYTTSSCAGRCFLYRGRGVKSAHNLNAQQQQVAAMYTNAVGNSKLSEGQYSNTDSQKSTENHSTSASQQQQQPHFLRFRVSHDLIQDPYRYFDLSTLDSDPSGGGDPIRSIGQYDHLLDQPHRTQQQIDELETTTKHVQQALTEDAEYVNLTTERGQQSSESTHLRKISSSKSVESRVSDHVALHEANGFKGNSDAVDKSIWLRFEPFILHVACRSLNAASALMDAARPAFKNVGLTAWTTGNDNDSSMARCDSSRFIVAIWGDEGLEMPLSMPNGKLLYGSAKGDNMRIEPFVAAWLATLVNERHARNWSKIDRFVQAVRNMPVELDKEDQDEYNLLLRNNHCIGDNLKIPKSYDLVGDIAVLHSIATTNEKEQKAIGEAILQRNKAIRVVALRQSNLQGLERAPGDEGYRIIAGVQRSPLITTHNEYGIKCVVDLSHTFFSPRMGQERLRICQQVARGEHVLVLFCGVGMDAMQIAGRTEALSVTAIEQNEIAVQCAARSKQLLERNRAVKFAGAADRLEIIQGDVLEILPTLPRQYYDRVVAPRPKEGAHDGDLGTGDGGIAFLRATMPAMKPNGGECHWYDFAADHEFPACLRTRQLLERVGREFGLHAEILHVANAGSVATRQLRVCISFRIKKMLE